MRKHVTSNKSVLQGLVDTTTLIKNKKKINNNDKALDLQLFAALLLLFLSSTSSHIRNLSLHKLCPWKIF